MDNIGGVLENQVVEQTNPKRLWNPRGFTILSVLFSFLPSAILYSLNYGRLGYPKKRNISLAIAFVSFAILMYLSYVINESILRSIFFGLNIGAGYFMSKNQSKIFDDSISNGGRKASYILPVVISAVITSVFIFLIFYTVNFPDQKLMFENNELYYTERVQEDEAQKLGDYLSTQGFFNDTQAISVKIDKQSGVYAFSIIIDKSLLEDKALEQAAKDLCAELSSNVFNNSKVVIKFSDEVFNPLKTISE